MGTTQDDHDAQVLRLLNQKTQVQKENIKLREKMKKLSAENFLLREQNSFFGKWLVDEIVRQLAGKMREDV